MTALPAKCGPYQDNLRHLYEGGRTLASVAYIMDTSTATVSRQLKHTGCVMRGRTDHKPSVRKKNGTIRKTHRR